MMRLKRRIRYRKSAWHMKTFLFILIGLVVRSSTFYARTLLLGYYYRIDHNKTVCIRRVSARSHEVPEKNYSDLIHLLMIYESFWRLVFNWSLVMKKPQIHFLRNYLWCARGAQISVLCFLFENIKIGTRRSSTRNKD